MPETNPKEAARIEAVGSVDPANEVASAGPKGDVVDGELGERGQETGAEPVGGDLRSGERRGQETRAKREETCAELDTRPERENTHAECESGPESLEKKAELGVVAGPATPPTDDTPTIISKAIPQRAASAFPLGEQLKGRQLAHFELLEAVGVGGMAAVIKARDLQLERCVALKILPPEAAKDPDSVDRFHQEARAAAKLDHENIARVFFCGNDQSLHFIAFEYVEGETLRSIIDRRQRLPVREAVHYMLQVASGLAHAAARGVVHRDIKPSNIIITPTGRAKLVDMGLARHLEQPFDKGLTHSGVTLGTFDYISPEQAEEPRNADVRSDIYSLGCTFYHVLTGQPTVPEGTAAKKLKHHQTVAPIDPRQLNPEIPDDVTAILARMMAKDPKDRYQRAEQLVQHLILVAQRVGASASLPEGPLYVDAALPQPPQARPLVVTAIAVAALLVLVFAIGQFGRGPAAGDGNPQGIQGRGSKSGSLVEATSALEKGSKSSAEGSVKGDVTPPRQQVVYNGDTTARALAAFLRDTRPDADVVVDVAGGDVDLSDADPENGRPLLVFHGRKLTIQSREASNPLTIRLMDGSSSEPGKVLAALEAECDDLVLKNVRFVVASESADADLACVLARCGKKLQIEQCQFVLAQPATENAKRRSAALVLDGRKETLRPIATVHYCSFVGAEAFQPGASAEDATVNGIERCDSDALLLQGPYKLDVSHCAFGPHSAFLHAEGRFADQLVVKCTNCTGLLAGGSVVSLEDEIAAAVMVKQSVFAAAGSDAAEPEGRQSILLRQTDDPGDVTFRGEGNCYYHLDAYWLRQGEKTTSLLESDTSTVLKKHPWSPAKGENQLKALEHPSRLREVFQLDDQRIELRHKDTPTKLVGVDHVPGAPSYNAGLVAIADKKPIRIVDPTVSQSGGGIYPSLATALREARPHDQILLRHAKGTKVLRESLIVLDRPDLDVVIAPDEGYEPVLMLEESSEPDPALFRVHRGKIEFEHIEFVLQPHPGGESASQSLFSLLGDCHVTFKNCTFMLDRSQRNIPLAAVRLDDVTKDGKPLKSDRKPVLRFEDCLVRAEGDLVKARDNQPLDLSLASSFVATTDNLLNIESTTPSEARIHLRCEKSTICLGANLLRLQQRGKDVRGNIPLHGDNVSDCLFVAVKGAPLIFLEGVAPGDDRMRPYFTWEAKNNAYVNFKMMLNQSVDDGMAMIACGTDEWVKIYNDRNARFPNAPNSETLARLLSLQLKYRPEPQWQGVGVGDMDSLPTPHWPLDKGARPEEE
jgi:serine/threonine protein kinase